MQQAFILHTRPYRDTSLLVELLTKDNGRLTAIARGVRSSRSRINGLCTLFVPVFIELSGKGELQILKTIEPDGPSYNLIGNVLLSCFYLNELLIKLLHKYEAQPSIFDNYKNTLIALSTAPQNLEATLRSFELALLADLGFGLILDKTCKNELVLPDQEYIFEYGIGLIKAKQHDSTNFLGANLLALNARELKLPEDFKSAKRLLRYTINQVLGNKQLKSRELF